MNHSSACYEKYNGLIRVNCSNNEFSLTTSAFRVLLKLFMLREKQVVALSKQEIVQKRMLLKFLLGKHSSECGNCDLFLSELSP
jgi:hypothetical protein